MAEAVLRYFPEITPDQADKFFRMMPAYTEWNSRINVISRKDMENFYLHHVLHSLAIARFIRFTEETRVLDVGTGGGFPGIPLAVLFPGTHFTLIDSIRKKIKVVEEICSALSISNVSPVWSRIEEHKGSYDFIVSRAVTSFPEFVKLTEGKIRNGKRCHVPNGIIYLKGGEFMAELGPFAGKVSVVDISSYFSEPFFETKRIIYLPC